MEEKNELNDIILNKSGGGSGSKKLLLAIAALTLILIIVLVIMNSLKSESNESAPHAAMPPEPSAPTEIIDDPLFEPVEVIQEGNTTPAGSEDLGKIAQKIKQESFDTAPVQETTVVPAIESAPAVQPKPAPQRTAPTPAPVATPAPKTVPKPAAKPVQAVVNTPTIKSVKPAEAKKATETAPKPVATRSSAAIEKPEAKASAASAETASKTANAEVIYYIQVGSFTKQPNQALFDRLNASGMKYTTVPSGAATKVLVGPFKGEKAARDVLGTVRRNIESGAYITKG